MGIAENIRLLREHYQLTQTDFGKIAGVSDKAVWTWENGTAAPRMGALQKIADHFGIPKSAIIENDPNGLFADPIEKELQFYFHSLNAEGQEKLCDYAKLLVLSGSYIKNTIRIAWWVKRKKL